MRNFYLIKKVEQRLGVTLFIRQGRRSVMTPAGLTLLTRGKEILLALEQLEKNIVEIDPGWEPELNIAIDSILSIAYIYPLLDKFYQQRPQTKVNLYEEVLVGTWESVINGKVDLVIGAANKPIPNQ